MKLLSLTVLACVSLACVTSAGADCIAECPAKWTGWGHQCDGCDGYVRCIRGRMFTMPCGPGTVWDNTDLVCDYESSTCSDTATTQEPPTQEPPTQEQLTPEPPTHETKATTDINKNDNDDSRIDFAINGEWGRWHPWSDCNSTCGGGQQQRSRSCDNPAPQHDGEECVGRDTETRTCSDWPCPDCTKVCPEGAILIECTVCVCDNVDITGRVRIKSQPPRPIAGVSVRNVEQEWEVANETDASGRFHLQNLCMESLQLKFNKAGFETEYPKYIISSAYTEVYMLEIGIDFQTHPTSTSLFEGGNVTLTCEARGYPAILYYDWLKNGNVIRYGDTVGENSNQLFVAPSSGETSASYQCRAVTYTIKGLSKAATVTVQNTGDDTCDPTPTSFLKKLPPGCSARVDGTQVTTVDIGKCAKETCSRRDTTENDFSKSCCGYTKRRNAVVTCTSSHYKLIRITECGCTVCLDAVSSEVITIKGIIYLQTRKSSGELENNVPGFPIKFKVGDIVHTAIPGGSFEFSMEREADNTALKFTPTKNETYMKQVVSVSLYSGVSEYYVTVVLLPKPEPKKIDPNVESFISIAESGEDREVITLDIPGQSFVDENGDVVTEDIEMFISFSDPTDMTSLETAPGQFSFRDDEGREENLLSFGVLNIMAQTPSGQDVSFSKDLTTEIDPEALGLTAKDIENLFTWSLDGKTGQWTNPQPLALATPATKRRKRQTYVLIGTLSVNRDNIWNYDVIIPWEEQCQIAVVPYIDDSKTTTVSGVQLTAYSQSNTGQFSYMNQVSRSPLTTCLTVGCGREATIVPKSFGFVPCLEQHLPKDVNYTKLNKNQVVIQVPDRDQITTQDGPFYQYDCVAANLSSYHVQYFYNNKFPEDIVTPPVTENPADLSAFYSGRACYVRIGFYNAEPGIAITGQSYKYETFRPANNFRQYGTRVNSVLPLYKEGTRIEGAYFSCVEVRCPGMVLDDSGWEDLTETYTTITYQSSQDLTLAWIKNSSTVIDVEGSSDTQINLRFTAGDGTDVNGTLDRSRYLFSATYEGNYTAILAQKAREDAFLKCSLANYVFAAFNNGTDYYWSDYYYDYYSDYFY